MITFYIPTQSGFPLHLRTPHPSFCSETAQIRESNALKTYTSPDSDRRKGDPAFIVFSPKLPTTPFLSRLFKCFNVLWYLSLSLLEVLVLQVFYLVWFLYHLPSLHLYCTVLYFMKRLVNLFFKDAIETWVYYTFLYVFLLFKYFCLNIEVSIFYNCCKLSLRQIKLQNAVPRSELN